MKRFIAILLFTAMILGTVACSNNNSDIATTNEITYTTTEPTTKKETEPTETSVETTEQTTENTEATIESTYETTIKPTEKPAQPTQKPTEITTTETTEATTESTDKPTAPSEELTSSLEDIFKSIYTGLSTEMPKFANFEITKENSEYYLGIKEMDFLEALASEAMIGSIAHSVCLVRVVDGSDIESIKNEIKSNVNPRKWICVEAETVIVDNIGNTIILIMDNFAPEEIHNNFLSLK